MEWILTSAVVIIQIAIMVYCLINLSKKSRTKYLNKTLWIIIIFFGSLLGQGIYLALESNN
ncbi:PLDc N-terminal domain-containing protein [Acetanaerobacterium elongatum]|uniref:Phospholipase_D-nuclease N-terminal n=1 Tax=Acetanaerobacterium elongatum TaxID=258515 RepID=A0A1G9Y0I3_9FIRM|nr:Phospholipase_D-nuclease N-terminal [Acetanaerobacterium elongatum]